MHREKAYEINEETSKGAYKQSGVPTTKGEEKGLLLKLEWPGEGIFDDGKQNNALTGASHPGCCKQ